MRFAFPSGAERISILLTLTFIVSMLGFMLEMRAARVADGFSSWEKSNAILRNDFLYVRSTSIVPSVPNNKLITPFTVKKANPIFDKSVGDTSPCSIMSNPMTIVTPAK